MITYIVALSTLALPAPGGGGVETTPSTNGFSSVTFARGRKSKIKFGLKSFNDDQIGEHDKI